MTASTDLANSSRSRPNASDEIGRHVLSGAEEQRKDPAAIPQFARAGTPMGGLRVLGANVVEYDRIVVPQPVNDYSTSRVLTMDLIDGRNVGRFQQLDIPAALAEADRDGVRHLAGRTVPGRICDE